LFASQLAGLVSLLQGSLYRGVVVTGADNRERGVKWNSSLLNCDDEAFLTVMQ